MHDTLQSSEFLFIYFMMTDRQRGELTSIWFIRSPLQKKIVQMTNDKSVADTESDGS